MQKEKCLPAREVEDDKEEDKEDEDEEEDKEGMLRRVIAMSLEEQ